MPNLPTDYNGYLGPPIGSGFGLPIQTGYPLWVYHPILPAQIVNDPNAQAALVASDGRWATTDPNATT
jgi:hypothetical protein